MRRADWCQIKCEAARCATHLVHLAHELPPCNVVVRLGDAEARNKLAKAREALCLVGGWGDRCAVRAVCEKRSYSKPARGVAHAISK